MLLECRLEVALEVMAILLFSTFVYSLLFTYTAVQILERRLKHHSQPF